MYYKLIAVISLALLTQCVAGLHKGRKFQTRVLKRNIANETTKGFDGTISSEVATTPQPEGFLAYLSNSVSNVWHKLADSFASKKPQALSTSKTSNVTTINVTGSSAVYESDNSSMVLNSEFYSSVAIFDDAVKTNSSELDGNNDADNRAQAVVQNKTHTEVDPVDRSAGHSTFHLINSKLNDGQRFALNHGAQEAMHSSTAFSKEGSKEDKKKNGGRTILHSGARNRIPPEKQVFEEYKRSKVPSAEFERFRKSDESKYDDRSSKNTIIRKLVVTAYTKQHRTDGIALPLKPVLSHAMEVRHRPSQSEFDSTQHKLIKNPAKSIKMVKIIPPSKVHVNDSNHENALEILYQNNPTNEEAVNQDQIKSVIIQDSKFPKLKSNYQDTYVKRVGNNKTPVNRINEVHRQSPVIDLLMSTGQPKIVPKSLTHNFEYPKLNDEHQQKWNRDQNHLKSHKINVEHQAVWPIKVHSISSTTHPNSVEKGLNNRPSLEVDNPRSIVRFNANKLSKYYPINSKGLKQYSVTTVLNPTLTTIPPRKNLGNKARTKNPTLLRLSAPQNTAIGSFEEYGKRDRNINVLKSIPKVTDEKGKKELKNVIFYPYPKDTVYKPFSKSPSGVQWMKNKMSKQGLIKLDLEKENNQIPTKRKQLNQLKSKTEQNAFPLAKIQNFNEVGGTQPNNLERRSIIAQKIYKPETGKSRSRRLKSLVKNQSYSPVINAATSQMDDKNSNSLRTYQDEEGRILFKDNKRPKFRKREIADPKLNTKMKRDYVETGKKAKRKEKPPKLNVSIQITRDIPSDEDKQNNKDGDLKRLQSIENEGMSKFSNEKLNQRDAKTVTTLPDAEEELQNKDKDVQDESKLGVLTESSMDSGLTDDAEELNTEGFDSELKQNEKESNNEEETQATVEQIQNSELEEVSSTRNYENQENTTNNVDQLSNEYQNANDESSSERYRKLHNLLKDAELRNKNVKMTIEILPQTQENQNISDSRNEDSKNKYLKSAHSPNAEIHLGMRQAEAGSTKSLNDRIENVIGRHFDLMTASSNDIEFLSKININTEAKSGYHEDQTNNETMHLPSFPVENENYRKIGNKAENSNDRLLTNIVTEVTPDYQKHKPNSKSEKLSLLVDDGNSREFDNKGENSNDTLFSNIITEITPEYQNDHTNSKIKKLTTFPDEIKVGKHPDYVHKRGNNPHFTEDERAEKKTNLKKQGDTMELTQATDYDTGEKLEDKKRHPKEKIRNFLNTFKDNDGDVTSEGKTKVTDENSGAIQNQKAEELKVVDKKIKLQNEKNLKHEEKTNEEQNKKLEDTLKDLDLSRNLIAMAQLFAKNGDNHPAVKDVGKLNKISAAESKGKSRLTQVLNDKGLRNPEMRPQYNGVDKGDDRIQKIEVKTPVGDFIKIIENLAYKNGNQTERKNDKLAFEMKNDEKNMYDKQSDRLEMNAHKDIDEMMANPKYRSTLFNDKTRKIKSFHANSQIKNEQGLHKNANINNKEDAERSNALGKQIKLNKNGQIGKLVKNVVNKQNKKEDVLRQTNDFSLKESIPKENDTGKNKGNMMPETNVMEGSLENPKINLYERKAQNAIDEGFHKTKGQLADTSETSDTSNNFEESRKDEKKALSKKKIVMVKKDDITEITEDEDQEVDEILDDVKDKTVSAKDKHGDSKNEIQAPENHNLDDEDDVEVKKTDEEIKLNENGQDAELTKEDIDEENKKYGMSDESKTSNKRELQPKMQPLFDEGKIDYNKDGNSATNRLTETKPKYANKINQDGDDRDYGLTNHISPTQYGKTESGLRESLKTKEPKLLFDRNENGKAPTTLEHLKQKIKDLILQNDKQNGNEIMLNTKLTADEEIKSMKVQRGNKFMDEEKDILEESKDSKNSDKSHTETVLVDKEEDIQGIPGKSVSSKNNNKADTAKSLVAEEDYRKGILKNTNLPGNRNGDDTTTTTIDEGGNTQEIQEKSKPSRNTNEDSIAKDSVDEGIHRTGIPKNSKLPKNNHGADIIKTEVDEGGNRQEIQEELTPSKNNDIDIIKDLVDGGSDRKGIPEKLKLPENNDEADIITTEAGESDYKQEFRSKLKPLKNNNAANVAKAAVDEVSDDSGILEKPQLPENNYEADITTTEAEGRDRQEIPLKSSESNNDEDVKNSVDEESKINWMAMDNGSGISTTVVDEDDAIQEIFLKSKSFNNKDDTNVTKGSVDKENNPAGISEKSRLPETSNRDDITANKDDDVGKRQEIQEKSRPSKNNNVVGNTKSMNERDERKQISKLSKYNHEDDVDKDFVSEKEKRKNIKQISKPSKNSIVDNTKVSVNIKGTKKKLTEKSKPSKHEIVNDVDKNLRDNDGYKKKIHGKSKLSVKKNAADINTALVDEIDKIQEYLKISKPSNNNPKVDVAEGSIDEEGYKKRIPKKLKLSDSNNGANITTPVDNGGKSQEIQEKSKISKTSIEYDVAKISADEKGYRKEIPHNINLPESSNEADTTTAAEAKNNNREKILEKSKLLKNNETDVAKSSVDKEEYRERISEKSSNSANEVVQYVEKLVDKEDYRKNIPGKSKFPETDNKSDIAEGSLDEEDSKQRMLSKYKNEDEVIKRVAPKEGNGNKILEAPKPSKNMNKLVFTTGFIDNVKNKIPEKLTYLDKNNGINVGKNFVDENNELKKILKKLMLSTNLNLTNIAEGFLQEGSKMNMSQKLNRSKNNHETNATTSLVDEQDSNRLKNKNTTVKVKIDVKDNYTDLQTDSFLMPGNLEDNASDSRHREDKKPRSETSASNVEDKELKNLKIAPENSNLEEETLEEKIMTKKNLVMNTIDENVNPIKGNNQSVEYKEETVINEKVFSKNKSSSSTDKPATDNFEEVKEVQEISTDKPVTDNSEEITGVQESSNESPSVNEDEKEEKFKESVKTLKLEKSGPNMKIQEEKRKEVVEEISNESGKLNTDDFEEKKHMLYKVINNTSTDEVTTRHDIRGRNYERDKSDKISALKTLISAIEEKTQGSNVEYTEERRGKEVDDFFKEIDKIKNMVTKEQTMNVNIESPTDNLKDPFEDSTTEINHLLD